MVPISRASMMAKVAISIASIFSSSSLLGDASSSNGSNSNKDPILLRAARGETVERTPVWMMRQAGRHMEAYRNLITKYPTFRERSEIPDVALEISLQPFDAYGVDGVILFSDILTPLPEMGIEFDITEGGKISIQPIRTRDDYVKRLKRTTLETFEKNGSSSSSGVVGTVLRGIREYVGNRATVLGFIGLPYTIATYLVEGKTGSATGFKEMNKLQQSNPQLLHDILQLLADNLADYACYQISNGAQVIQVFDSWAGHLNDSDYRTFALRYQQRVIATIKDRHPDTPIIIYMAPSKYSRDGNRLSELAKSGANIISIDQTVDISKAGRVLRLDKERRSSDVVGIQGNLDPQLLRDGSLDDIKRETEKILSKTHGISHIMNLGHGILPDTPERNANFFIKTVKEYELQEK